MKRRLKKIVPWLLGLGMIAYLFYKISLGKLLGALGRSNLPWLIGAVFFVDFGSLFTDTFATAKIFTWFLTPISFVELVPVRAATYLMAILNYNLGQAGLIYYIHRTKKVPVLAVTGLILMMMGTVFLGLGVFSIAGVVLAVDPVARRFGWILSAFGIGSVVYFAVIRVRPAWLKRFKLLQPLVEAGVSGHLWSLVVRLPHVAVIVLTHFWAMRCFGIEVPIGVGLVYIPLLLLVATLPLTPFGLGTMQGTAIYFFSRYSREPTAQAREAAVLAYSLSLSALTLALQALMGLVCLKWVSDLVAKPEAEPPLNRSE
jgi:hypothetical protein